MIKAIIFDFDGVILESVDIKTEAFRDLFKSYPKHLKAILDYHLEHGGVSRQEKIKYFYKDIIKEPLSDGELKKLCDRFEELVKQKVIRAPFVKGAEELLKKCFGRFKMFVVSGTPQDEVRDIVRNRKLQDYFVHVFGSPDKKTEITRKILDTYRFVPSEVVFVGDAVTDLNAAKETGIYFIGRAQDPKAKWAQDNYVLRCCPDLRDVYTYIDELDREK